MKDIFNKLSVVPKMLWLLMKDPECGEVHEDCVHDTCYEMLVKVSIMSLHTKLLFFATYCD